MACCVINYNDKIISFDNSLSSYPVVYNSVTIANLAVGDSKTLNCAGNVAKTDILIGNKRLNCAGKFMNFDIQISVRDEVILNAFTIPSTATSLEIIRDL